MYPPHSDIAQPYSIALDMLRLLFPGFGVQGDHGGAYQGAWGRHNNGEHRGILRREDRQRTARENL